jgi:hypothetical protein
VSDLLARYYDESLPPSLWEGPAGPPAPVITNVNPLFFNATVGGTFTITGTGFAPNAEVRMGMASYQFVLNIDSRTGSTVIVATALPNQVTDVGPTPILVRNGPLNGGDSNPVMINGSVTSTSTKAYIVAWLLAHGVTLDEGALMQLTKAELMTIVTDLTDTETPTEPEPEPMPEPEPEPEA